MVTPPTDILSTTLAASRSDLAGDLMAPARLALRLDAVLDRWTDAGSIVGVVALVARGGEVIYHRAAGYADREAGTQAAETSIFRFASITKPLVSATALALVERSDLSLDDPLTRWLPDFTPATSNGRHPCITIRHVMTHTSGLSYSFLADDDTAYADAGFDQGMGRSSLALAENIEPLASAPLYHVPGEDWRYSPSTDVLGAVIEAATGLTLPEALAQYVTRPLGMVDTGFHVAETDRLAVAYRDGAGAPIRMSGQDLHYPIGPSSPFFAGRVLDPQSAPSGGAGASGTAIDFLRFLEALRTGGAPILSPASAAAMSTHAIGDLRAWTEGPGWGFGLGAAVLLDPAAAGSPQTRGTWQWGGILGGHWFVDPAKKLSVVVLTNTCVAGVIGAFPAEVRNAVYGIPAS
ncbi:serine hydrolase domain-containing protein [Hyphomonas sp.]|uniref:serine hydrolase domain-containing protein n=1 Tax=Hyphomonas sp. TaxID=87 RepID=UPI003F730979